LTGRNQLKQTQSKKVRNRRYILHDEERKSASIKLSGILERLSNILGSLTASEQQKKNDAKFADLV
jgi:hypothetical protein